MSLAREVPSFTISKFREMSGYLSRILRALIKLAICTEEPDGISAHGELGPTWRAIPSPSMRVRVLLEGGR